LLKPIKHAIGGPRADQRPLTSPTFKETSFNQRNGSLCKCGGPDIVKYAYLETFEYEWYKIIGHYNSYATTGATLTTTGATLTTTA
jgi:hypothetical protein